jgi:hypothetical protein
VIIDSLITKQISFTVINALRAYFDNPSLPFIIGQSVQSPYAISARMAFIRECQAASNRQISEGRRRTGGFLQSLIHAEDTAQRRAILDTLQTIAEETGANAGQVAIAWRTTWPPLISRCRLIKSGD